MRRKHSFTGIPLALALSLAAGATRAAPVRIKELVELQGVRENMLYGYGLVVGLAGTGDTERTLYTSQSVSGMLGRLGIRIDPKDVRVRNVAAVMVTARMPTFARPGVRIDATVASMGNARSLAGGVLLITPLTGPDGQVYALAQGAVQVGGFAAASLGTSVVKNQPTSGVVAAGAVIERAVTPVLGKGPVVLQLKQPDFTTATRIAEAINKALAMENVARSIDPAVVEVRMPDDKKTDPVVLISRLEALEVEADQRARVVVSERTGTVVAGERVRIRAVAVAHGGLSIRISNAPFAFQPTPTVYQSNAPLPQGTVARAAQVDAEEKKQPVTALPATSSIEDLVKALNLLGASPRDLISILQAMKAAGAIDADLEVL